MRHSELVFVFQTCISGICDPIYQKNEKKFKFLSKKQFNFFYFNTKQFPFFCGNNCIFIVKNLEDLRFILFLRKTYGLVFVFCFSYFDLNDVGVGQKILQIYNGSDLFFFNFFNLCNFFFPFWFMFRRVFFFKKIEK